VILHVDFAVKQDQELGQDWLRYVKVRDSQLTPASRRCNNPPNSGLSQCWNTAWSHSV
jgi:hypothetical protein